jgi:hypothetical protein
MKQLQVNLHALAQQVLAAGLWEAQALTDLRPNCAAKPPKRLPS